jgi:lipopolysaccharide biosynthesis glycosyltransferase
VIPIYITLDNNYKDHWRHVYNSIKANTRSDISFNIICEPDVRIDASEDDINIICVEPLIEEYRRFNRFDTRAIYLRWLIPLLTKEDKAIYLDTDVVVTGDVKELWDIDIGDNYIAAVPSYIFKTVEEGFWQQGKCPGGDAKSYLSGQLLINCKKWRDDDVIKKLTDFSKQYNLLDEAPVSIVLKDSIYELDRHWCFPANYIEGEYKHEQMLYDYDINNIKLWHWSGQPKPWNGKARHQEVYERYI